MHCARCMAKSRSLNTKFWNDAWVRDELNPLDRYLFLYFLSNEHTNISGIYEIPLSTVAYETGLDKDDLAKSMIKRLKPKLYYFNSWVILVNFPKHQNLKSEDVVKGIKREFEALPILVQNEAMYRGWGDGLGIAPGTIPNLTKLISADKPRVVLEGSEDQKPKSKPKYPHSKEVFGWFPNPEPSWGINTTENKHAELLWNRGKDTVLKALAYVESHKDDDLFFRVLSPYDLETKWNKIADYAKRNR